MGLDTLVTYSVNFVIGPQYTVISYYVLSVLVYIISSLLKLQLCISHKSCFIKQGWYNTA